MAGIFSNLFGGGPDPQQQPAQPQQQQQQQPKDINQQANNGHQPTQQNPQHNQDPNSVRAFDESAQEDQSPLDKFADLFNMQDSKGGESGDDRSVQQRQDDANAAFFNVNHEDIEKTVNGINFVPQDQEGQQLVKRLQEGDMGALPELLNKTVQQAYLQQTNLNHNLMESLGKTVMERMNNQLPQQVQKISSKNELRQSNPVFNHAGAQPVVEAIASQVAQKYPDASPQEISQMTNEYMKAFADSMGTGEETNKDSGKNTNQGDSQQPDWTKFFTQGTPFG